MAAIDEEKLPARIKCHQDAEDTARAFEKALNHWILARTDYDQLKYRPEYVLDYKHGVNRVNGNEVERLHKILKDSERAIPMAAALNALENVQQLIHRIVEYIVEYMTTGKEDGQLKACVAHLAERFLPFEDRT